MRKVLALLILLCGAANAGAAETATAWCEGADKLTIENGRFYLNGKPLPENTVTDQTEETGIFWEYDGRLFAPCP